MQVIWEKCKYWGYVNQDKFLDGMAEKSSFHVMQIIETLKILLVHNWCILKSVYSYYWMLLKIEFKHGNIIT